MENNKEVVEPKETVKLDVFQHLRQTFWAFIKNSVGSLAERIWSSL